jgi:hypothetical protein
MIKCCHYCEARKLHCHEACERYRAEKEALEAAKAAKKKDDQMLDYIAHRRGASMSRWQHGFYRRPYNKEYGGK